MKLDYSLLTKIQRYMEIPYNDGGDFHPVKNKIVFVSYRTGIPQIYKMDLDKTQIIQLTFGENRETNTVYLPNGKFLFR